MRSTLIGTSKKKREATQLMQVVEISRGIAQSGSAPALGAGCRGFESLYPDHLFQASTCRQ